MALSNKNLKKYDYYEINSDESEYELPKHEKHAIAEVKSNDFLKLY